MIKSTKHKLEYDYFKRKYICMQFLRTNLRGNFRKWVKCKKKSLRKKCPYSELFRSAFSRIRTKYGEMWSSILFYSARMRENADQNNSGCGYLYLPFLNVAVYITN